MVIHFAKEPPPIGGVTIHVQRLNQMLSEKGFDSEIFDYSKKINATHISKIFSSQIIHLHVSNKLFRLILVLIFRLIGKRTIITFHGKYDFKHILDKLSLKICNYALLLNDYSYTSAKEISIKKISLLSAFIPPITLHSYTLNTDTIKLIEEIRNNFKFVFCTNAWDVVYDAEGNEIYGGSTLVKVFNEFTDIALIFSDPKGNYQMFFRKKCNSLPQNVFFINYNHDFVEVIQSCDALIRATSTDGDSLSVHEALYLRKDVVTTDVVNRPNGCILYSNVEELKSILYDFEKVRGRFVQYKYFDATNELLNIYSKLL